MDNGKQAINWRTFTSLAHSSSGQYPVELRGGFPTPPPLESQPNELFIKNLFTRDTNKMLCN